MFIVICRVSGGFTGTRESTLKANGQTVYFETEADAKAEALRLTQKMNGPYATASFSYSAARA